MRGTRRILASGPYRAPAKYGPGGPPGRGGAGGGAKSGPGPHRGRWAPGGGQAQGVALSQLVSAAHEAAASKVFGPPLLAMYAVKA